MAVEAKMKFPGKNSKLRLAGGLLVSMLVLAGCGDDMLNSELRVIHASKDAPPVNVRVGIKNVINDLDYGASSGYVAVRTGVSRLAVEAILPAKNADVITVRRFQFEGSQRYNVLAINDTADIEPLVIEEASANPSVDEVAIAVVHASTNAAEVDVYVSEFDPLGDLSLEDAPIKFTLDYTGVFDAPAVPAAKYRIRVTGAGSDEVVYNSGEVDLTAFGGQKLLLAAISSENETELAASPIKLLAAPDGDAQLTLLDEETTVGARVVHLSPDAGAVEVYASSPVLGDDPFKLIESFSYTDVVPTLDNLSETPVFASVPSGDYVFDVAPAGAGFDNRVMRTPKPDPLPLETGVEYTVIAAGNLTRDPAFGLLATADDNRVIVTQASVKVVHAAPAAGLVNVFVTPSEEDFSVQDLLDGDAGKPLLENFAFGTITPYVPLTPGKYDIRVFAGTTAAIDIEDFELPPGLVGTVIARQPIDGGGMPDDFGVVVLTNEPPPVAESDNDDDDIEDDD